PEGLVANGDEISGTPSVSGDFPVKVTVKDAEGFETEVTLTLHVTIAPELELVLSDIELRGKVGLDYGSHRMSARGGTEPYRFEAAPLPEGLVINDGIISGTPNEAGETDVTFKVTDSDGYTQSQTLKLVIDPASVIVIDFEELVDGKLGVDYGEREIRASGGTDPYTYQIEGLPDGLSADGNKVKGTPVKDGSFDVTVRVRDQGGYEAEETQTVSIAPAPEISFDLGDLVGGTIGVDYGTHRVTASGGADPYRFEFGGLPDGLTGAEDGTITGKPTRSGPFDVLVMVTDANGFRAEQTQTILIGDEPFIVVDVSDLVDGTVGVDYGVRKVAASGGTEPYSYRITGLPAGLSAEGDTVTGTPTEAGTFTVSVEATDAEGFAKVETQTIAILAEQPAIVLDLSNLDDGKVGLDYGSHKVAASGGSAPYTYVFSGLPDGLSADGDTVTGKPTTAGSYPVRVTVTDATGATASDTQTIEIAPAPTIVIDLNDLVGGKVGVDYGRHEVRADGGTAPYRWQISGLPDGLTAEGNTVFGKPVRAGSFEVSVVVMDAEGYLASRAQTVAIQDRPDPSKDPEVIGLVNAQVAATNRMTKAQISNFQQRLEQLHEEGECRMDSLGVALSIGEAHLQPKLGGKTLEQCSELRRKLSFWTNGQINLGTSDDDVDERISHTGINVSGGVDYRFSPQFIGGIGFGYGKDISDIGQRGTQSRASMFSAAVYGSYHPRRNIFLDGVLGYGWLNFDNQRYVTDTGAMAHGERSGSQLFGSLTLGYELRGEEWLVSPYLRVDAAHATLSRYSETGADMYNLTFGKQTVDMFSTTLGLRGEYTIDTDWGVLKPKGRLEYTHDFAGASKATLGYTDTGLLPFTIDASPEERDSFAIGFGFDLNTYNDWAFGIEYSTQVSTGGGPLQHIINWKLSKQF
ncbi:putative Ig domain-containing protein, partial [Brucella intermedia]|uniref:autotransporter family protein n=1 Tax=Brucella intermedia TaxID=94625 RepID=UPI0011150934